MKQSIKATDAALWIKKASNGKEYFSVKVEFEGGFIWVNLFENSYKTNDKQPAYKMIKEKAQTQGGQQVQEDHKFFNVPNGPIDDGDDIPF